MGLIDTLRARKAAINRAAGLSNKPKAAPKKAGKKKRTKVSEFSNEELRNMSDEQYMKLRMDI